MKNIRPHDFVIRQRKLRLCGQSDFPYCEDIHSNVAFEFLISKLRESAYLKSVVAIPYIHRQYPTDVRTVNSAAALEMGHTPQANMKQMSRTLYRRVRKIARVQRQLL